MYFHTIENTLLIDLAKSNSQHKMKKILENLGEAWRLDTSSGVIKSQYL